MQDCPKRFQRFGKRILGRQSTGNCALLLNGGEAEAADGYYSNENKDKYSHEYESEAQSTTQTRKELAIMMSCMKVNCRNTIVGACLTTAPSS